MLNKNKQQQIINRCAVTKLGANFVGGCVTVEVTYERDTFETTKC